MLHTFPSNMFLSLLLLGLQIIAVLSSNDKAEEVPGFFLKVTKNVPRIGRSSGGEIENFFLKQSKSVPRIGRRNSQVRVLCVLDKIIFSKSL